jgi:hypothetical protein
VAAPFLRRLESGEIKDRVVLIGGVDIDVGLVVFLEAALGLQQPFGSRAWDPRRGALLIQTLSDVLAHKPQRDA